MKKKHLGKSETKVSRKTYKVKATRKITEIKLKPEPKKKSRQQELEEYEKILAAHKQYFCYVWSEHLQANFTNV